MLRTIGMRQRSGMGRSLLIILTIVVSVALLAWAAYVALFVFHLGSHIGITL